jgi:hypothetical protein
MIRKDCKNLNRAETAALAEGGAADQDGLAEQGEDKGGEVERKEKDTRP